MKLLRKVFATVIILSFMCNISLVSGKHFLQFKEYAKAATNWELINSATYDTRNVWSLGPLIQQRVSDTIWIFTTPGNNWVILLTATESDIAYYDYYVKTTATYNDGTNEWTAQGFPDFNLNIGEEFVYTSDLNTDAHSTITQEIYRKKKNTNPNMTLSAHTENVTFSMLYKPWKEVA